MGVVGKKLQVAIMAALIVVFSLSSVTAKGVEKSAASSSGLEDCFGSCYAKCDVTRPLWCASLCVGKCKHGGSVPDNLCNCTYSCSKFMCANVGSDAKKVESCVMRCSKLCTIKY